MQLVVLAERSDGDVLTAPTGWWRPLRGDRGFTLTEVLVSIVLMGTVITVILSAILTLIRVSSSSNDAAKVEAVLTSAADRLAGWAYLSCPEANDTGYDVIVSAAADDVHWTHDNAVIIKTIRYWDPLLGASTNAATDPNPADGGWADTNALVSSDGCGEDVSFTTTRTLQQVTIEARSPSGAIVRRLEVIKSNVGDRIEVSP
ncbi:MAG: prepilin-type N-terminal cleavage/methylation domain-containing protein [Candidatus Azotimanducaceae bacterium]|jgi:prepilin-type N-terminal cleavage/methylation domain-containing protein